MGSKYRNSSIELLRLVAMFMILEFHYIDHNGYSIKQLPMGFNRLFFELCMGGVGKIAVIIFFSISVWFYLDTEQNLRSNVRRIWLLERELLFWSIGLAVFYLVFFPSHIERKQLVKSLLPLTFGKWWYATAYAMFLALLPFLSVGLKRLGRNLHIGLAATTLVMWGIPSFIPGSFNVQPPNVFGFIYVFILISAYKWYFKPASTKALWWAFGSSVVIILLYALASVVLWKFGINKGIYITGDWKLPVIVIGISVFLLVERVHFYNRFINFLAGSAFAVYLITDTRTTRELLWGVDGPFNLKQFIGQPYMILRVLAVLIAIYAVCIALDLCRRGLFRLTVNRNPGRLFDYCWQCCLKLVQDICSKTKLEQLLS